MTATSWIEVRVAAPDGWGELVAEALALDGCTSVAFGRPNLRVTPAPEGHDYVRTFYSAHLDGPDRRAAIATRLADLARRTGAPELAYLEATFKALPHEDWATSWRKVWRPFRVGRLCLVTRDWSRPLRPDDRRLQLEPGGAFGTGRHATTRMCLHALQEFDLEGTRVLDAGSGSGILSVAAALLGARSVLGFDIDARAVVEGAELARDNGVEAACAFRLGDFGSLTDDDDGFDLVLGNIYSDVLQDHAANLAQRLRAGGRCVLSGCPDRHERATAEALTAGGLELREIRRRGRWSTFLGHRPSAA